MGRSPIRADFIYSRAVDPFYIPGTFFDLSVKIYRLMPDQMKKAMLYGPATHVDAGRGAPLSEMVQ